MAKAHKQKNPHPGTVLPPQVSAGEALKWFAANFGGYLGSRRGLFLSHFSEEDQVSLESCLVSLKQRQIMPLVINGDTLFRQAEYLFGQAAKQSAFGAPLESNCEQEFRQSDLVIIESLAPPEKPEHLWYLYHYLLYPRALANKATIITTPLAYEDFIRVGSACPQPGEKAPELFDKPTLWALTWEKFLWLCEATMINLSLFSMTREQGLPPMLAAEYYLWMSLAERGIEAVPQYVHNDNQLDLAVIVDGYKLDIECESLAFSSQSQASEVEMSRHQALFGEGWQIICFSTKEIFTNHAGCADAVEALLLREKSAKANASQSGGTGSGLPGRLVRNALGLESPQSFMQAMAQANPGYAIDPEQANAVGHIVGASAIVGGAGSGKTSCLVQKAAYLIEQGVSPEKILILTHSGDTVENTKELLAKALAKELVLRVNISTWHDFGFKIIKENPQAAKRKAPIKIESSPHKVINRLLARYGKDFDQTKLELSGNPDEFMIGEAIAFLKSRLVSAKQVKGADSVKGLSADSTPQAIKIDSFVLRMYHAYEEQMQKSNRIDRDDMICLAVQSLIDRSDLKTRYQNLFDYVLVDEFQETSLAQEILARLLSGPEGNLTIVGNPDECISQSAGALPEAIAGVSFRLPEAKCFVLENNWRSQTELVRQANKLLGHYAERPITFANKAASKRPPVVDKAQVYESEVQEVEQAVRQIKELISVGRSGADIGVFFCDRRYQDLLQESLDGQAVAYRTAAESESELLPDESGDLLAFLKLIVDPDGPKARESFEKTCQLRIKEVDPKLFATIAAFAEANNLSFLKAVEIYAEATADQSCKELEALVRVIRSMHQEGLPPAETIALLKRTQRLEEYYKAQRVPPEARYEPLSRINQLEREAKEFKTVAEFVKHIVARKQGQPSTTDGGLWLMPVTEAKGREFAIVFILGLASGIMPGAKANLENEDRRRCYVAFTRARERLIALCPQSFGQTACSPSKFLYESELLAEEIPVAQAEPVKPAAPAKLAAASTQAVKPLPSAAAQTQKPPVPPVQKTVQAPTQPPPQPAQQPMQRPATQPVPPVAQPASPRPPVQPAAQAPVPPPAPIQQPVQQPIAPAAQSAPVQQPPRSAPPPVSQAPVAHLPVQPTPKPAPQTQAQTQPPASPPQPPITQPAAQLPIQPPVQQPVPQPSPTLAAPPQVARPQAQAPAEPSEPVVAPSPPAREPRQTNNCPNCKSDLEGDPRFCGSCGFDLRQLVCVSCLAPIEASAKFCGECGTHVQK